MSEEMVIEVMPAASMMAQPYAPPEPSTCAEELTPPDDTVIVKSEKGLQARHRTGTPRCQQASSA